MHMILKRMLGSLLLVAVVMLFGTSDVWARDKAAVKAEFHKAFDVMYAHPGDVDAAMKYSALAVELNDYEAAIPPLERLLMMNPALPEVRLQVGTLYYLLNSFDNATLQLELVINDKTATPELVAKANSTLNKIKEKK